MTTTHVVYNGKRIIPAPMVSIVKNYVKDQNGDLVGTSYDVRVIGTLVVDRGSPNSAGEFYTGPGFALEENIAEESRLASLITKQEAIRQLFSENGKAFEIQSADGSTPLKFYPTIQSIEFQDGNWVNTCQYTISMTVDRIEIRGSTVEDSLPDGYSLAEASETWAIEVAEETTWEDVPSQQGGQQYTVSHYTYRVTHSVSARGVASYDDSGLRIPAWKAAQTWVKSRLGFDKNIINKSLMTDIVPSTVYDYTRSENIDETDGNCSVTETWLLSSNPYIETYDVSLRSEQSGRISVSINGNIKGLEVRDDNGQVVTTKYTNALNRFNAIGDSGFYLRAQDVAPPGITLNPVPLSYSVGHNKISGIINYSYTYDNRPSNQIDDTISETYTVTNSWGVDIFGSVSVLERTKGPVLQQLNMRQATTRELSLEIVFGTGYTGGNLPPSMVSPYREQIQTLIDYFKPVNSYVFDNDGNIRPGVAKQFVSNQSENWNPIDRRYAYNVTWTYEAS